MVGGWIIDIAAVSAGIARLWCVDRHATECAVHVREEPEMPKVGDEIWWQAGKVYWDGDRRTLEKIGYSYTPGDDDEIVEGGK